MGAPVETEPRQPWSPRFSATARAVADAARALGLAVPGFRSPPGPAGADRTLRRLPDGRCVVAVRAKGRPPRAVLDDLVTGVVVANNLRGDDAQSARRRLLEVVAPVVSDRAA